MRNRFLILAALFVLIACASVLTAEAPMTTLTVAVKTLADSPIDRASVIVKFVKGRSKVKLGKKTRITWETRTNQEGLAKIPPIPQGSIQVQVIAKGYQTFGQIFDVDEQEKTIEIKLNPPQAQYSAHQ
ncbi:MAG TPA: carboxypeptidase-like regulatory domain-containing protein [Bryobacteraceae bacterium]|nr:carboxypeptidase-like regulatory domain-containing protein [Bryobacteraceae bacterium]